MVELEVMMSKNQLPTWLADYVEAVNKHAPADVVAMMSEDVVVVDTAFGGSYTGRAAVEQLLSGMDAGLSSDYRFTVRKYLVSGSSYAFEWDLSGTNDRANPAMGLPGTGQAFTVPGLTIGERRDGLISENRDYWNVAALLTQLGVVPAPAGAPK
ncbi:ester cyclase [Actinacidiphila sp. bgisy144]|uniref:ester cyclase n=1 Tax=Actinacidiphila sp. bgisy144 TaxID=3413791 RepID=UPI003EBEAC81